LALAFAGTGAQYIKGDGTLATFPSIISQAQNLVTEVYNNTGATLTKGTIVYINGGQGNLPTVTKALATGDSTSAQTYGVVQTDITNMNNGYVVVAGRLTDLDTQAYSNGTQLYLSATTAGTWTPTKQYAPNHLVYVGIVVRSHPTQGVVEIKIQNGYELDELHNVAAQSPDNNDIIQYKTATSLWTKVAGTTSNIAEGTNLYYTDARSRAALSFTAGSGAYNSTTGVITIPTNTNQLTNGASFITLASLSAGAGISYNNTTGVIASTITQYTDALARAAISLTTTGTSGAATYNSTTGVLNIPQYQTALTNPVTGTGTTNYLPKFTGTSTIGNSQIFDNGTNVGIGTALPTEKLDVRGNIYTNGTNTNIYLDNGGAGGASLKIGVTGSTSTYINSLDAHPIIFSTSNTPRMTLTASGNLGLGVTPSAWSTSFGIKVIDLGSKGSVYASDNDANLSFNQFFDGTNAVYKTTGTASRFALIGNEFQWRQAPSGTAGNAISFTQAMTLDASGRLGIGVTSPTQNLEIGGTGNILVSGGGTIFSGPGALFVRAGSGGDLILGANNTNGLMRITSGGNVGIGVTPDSNANRTLQLHNASTGSTYFKISNTTSGSGINDGLDIGEINSDSYFINRENGFMTFWTNATERMKITSGGAVEITQTIQTGAPTNGTAQPWRLGNAVSGSISTNSYIIVSVNGTTYSIPALNGLP
jgi:hypothetical protein